MTDLDNYIEKNMALLDSYGHHSNDSERMSEKNKDKIRELQKKTEKAIYLKDKLKYDEDSKALHKRDVCGKRTEGSDNNTREGK
jgi:hypothetical protein